MPDGALSTAATDRLHEGNIDQRQVSSPTLIGYARVSTDDQDCAAQVYELRQAGCTTIVTETASGADRRRPALARLVATIAAGETLVIVRLDRLARSVPHLLQVLDQLTDRGAGLRSLRDPIDTTTAGGRFTLTILGAVAELERSLIIERTRAGVAAAARAGRLPGHPGLRARGSRDDAPARSQQARPRARPISPATGAVAGGDRRRSTGRHGRRSRGASPPAGGRTGAASACDAHGSGCSRRRTQPQRLGQGYGHTPIDRYNPTGSRMPAPLEWPPERNDQLRRLISAGLTIRATSATHAPGAQLGAPPVPAPAAPRPGSTGGAEAAPTWRPRHLVSTQHGILERRMRERLIGTLIRHLERMRRDARVRRFRRMIGARAGEGHPWR